MDSKKKNLTFSDFFNYLKSDNTIQSKKLRSRKPVPLDDGCEESESVKNPFTDSEDDIVQSKKLKSRKPVPLDDEWEESESVKNPFTDSEDDMVLGECSDADKDYLPSGEDSESEESEEHEERKAHPAVSKPQMVVEDSIESTNSSIVYPALHPASPITDCPSTISGECSPSVVSDNNRVVGSKKWNKQHACLFCHKLVIKMSAHLEKMHCDEPEVIKILLLGKGTAERRNQWNVLLQEGDYQHNVHVLKTGSGNIIKKYRSKNHDSNEYVACPHCKAMYLKSLLAIHAKNCFLNNGLNAKKGEAVKAGRLLMPVPKNVSENFYRKVLENMKDDHVSRLIRGDSLLLKFGERSFNSKDLEEHTYGHISGRLRELGRLICCLREKTCMKVSNLTQALHVKNFDSLLVAVKDIAEFDVSSHCFKKGSLALKIGYSLKKATKILKAEALKQDDVLLKKQADDFENLFSGDWYDYISASASQSIYRARQNKPKLLPACSDIEKLHQVLDIKLTQTTDYATLTKATLCSITLFNRKRGGEVQRMKLVDFNKGMLHGSTANPETVRGLTESEKKLLDYFSRVEIRGKFNRVVPVLLTAQMIKSIREIIDLRQNVSPPITSPYLFISRTGSRPYRGSDVVREFVSESGVSNPSLFTFTNLRKQIATLSQTLEISKWEQDQLATFLGHDIRVHRNIYRQPIDVLDRAKVAKILMSMNKGISLSTDQSVIVDDKDELEVGSDEDNDDSDDDHQQGLSSHEEEDSINSHEISNTGTVTEEETLQCEKSTSKGKLRKFKRKVWSQTEIDAVKRNLGYCIAMGRVPRKDEAEKTLAAEPVLRDRTWRNVKDFVYNIVKKKEIIFPNV